MTMTVVEKINAGPTDTGGGGGGRHPEPPPPPRNHGPPRPGRGARPPPTPRGAATPLNPRPPRLAYQLGPRVQGRGSKALTDTEGISWHTRTVSCRLVAPEPASGMMSTSSESAGLQPSTPSVDSAVRVTPTRPP